jgi:Family of unknown function (DUF6311)
MSSPLPVGSLSRRLLGDCSPAVAYGVTAVLGIAYVLWLLPLEFLLGHGAYFEQGDAANHVSGWLFFRADSWHFPLLHTARLSYPEGTSIALTDSIPLAALLVKPFAAWLPADFHYFGLWHGLAYLGQGLAAVFVLRALHCRSLAAALVGAAHASIAPVLFQRRGHSALMMHALLLLALGLYFTARRRPERAGSAAFALMGLASLALLVHPYFMAMSYLLFLACLMDRRRDGARLAEVSLLLGVSVAMMLGLAFVLGYSSGGASATGYGFYSMNLASPFCGGRFLACASDATGRQYEGFAYLGAGVLALLGIAIVANLRGLPRLVAQHAGLATVTAACTLFAVSNRVYLGSHLLIGFDLPVALAELAGVFRAGGRFAWVLVYVLLVSALGYLLSGERARGWGTLLAALLLPIQWLDVQPLREGVVRIARRPSEDSDPGLVEGLARARHFNFFPTSGCTALPIEYYNRVQRLAARAGLTLNTAFTPRGVPVPCAVKKLVFAEAFARDDVYALPVSELRKNVFGLPAGFKQAIVAGDCMTHQGLVYCFAGETLPGWRARGVEGDPVTGDSIGGVKELVFAAEDLPSQIGALVSGHLVPTAPDHVGYLSYGPYLSLDPGRYRATIQYTSANPPSEPAGRFEALAERRGAPVELAAGSFAGTTGAPGTAATAFDLDEHVDSFQVRTYFPGGTDLRVRAISVAREN